MKKMLTMIVTVAALGVGGWYGFQRYQAIHAEHAQKAQATANEAKQRAALAAAEAKLRARQAEIDSTRHDIETQLKPLKVTSIMPGQPGIAIINKKEYAEGDPLPLPGGKKQLQIAKVNEDGILLAYNGLTFHLDAPAAPDLDAIRKK